MVTADVPRAPLRGIPRLGYWSALMTALLAAIFLAMGMFGSSYTEGITYPYVLTTIRSVDYLLWIPAFFMAFTVIILLCCLHAQAPPEKKIYSEISLAFGILYAAIMIPDLFLQWTVVLPSLAHNETAAISLLSQYNPHGVFIAIESLGYLLLDTALLFTAAVFTGKARLERALKWLFITAFILNIAMFLVILLTRNNIVVFEVVAVTVNVAVLITAGILLSRWFTRFPPEHTGS